MGTNRPDSGRCRVPNVLDTTCRSCKLGRDVKLFLRLVNLIPLFAAFLIVGTVWKLTWQHVASRARHGSVASAIAGAAAYQWP